MSIRIRVVEGSTVALCAARTEIQEGDIYLDDNAHHALASKFAADWLGNGLLDKDITDPILSPLMEALES